MFLNYYGLRDQPFGVTPDPRYLYFGSAHREALASLLYGVQSKRGFLALIAKPGMGKTSLLFCLLEYLRTSAQTAFLFQTHCDSREFFRYLLSDLGIDSQGQDLARMHELLNEVLLKQMRAGRSFVLVVDEAQNLEDKVLESLRLLSNFETASSKLLQIVLAGQPQLAETLARPHLAQMRQRISAVIRLKPFSPKETTEYIQHRLRGAGYHGPPLFTPEALAMITSHSGGIPRNINNLCFSALSLGFATRRRRIGADIVREVLADLELDFLVERRAHTRLAGTPTPASTSAPHCPGKQSRLRFAAAILVLLGLVVASPKPLLDRARHYRFPWWFSSSTLEQTSPVAGARSTLSATPEPTVLGNEVVTNSVAPVEAQAGETKNASAPTDGQTVDEPSTVVVEPGHTLSSIARKYLGSSDGALIEEIRALNPEILDPNRLEPGQRIRFPKRSPRPEQNSTSP